VTAVVVDARYDLVVVGGGHAGCEAAVAASAQGAQVALVTLDRRMLAEMPCNPAVGGIGKGHLVAELDALGGLQGYVTDRAGLQFRVLNRSRGPAVWGPRAQCDKRLYRRLMAHLIAQRRGLVVVEGEVCDLLTGDAAVEGVRLADGRRLLAGAVVLTTGTFLDGLLHVGSERSPGGRFGERPSRGLGGSLRALGLELRRYKTGTPPRLERASLDYDRMLPQDGDEPARPFSFRTRVVRNRCRCWLTRTPPEVQRIIGDNLHRSPLFSGVIQGVGPRYCPSIEDKVVRFPHHEEHTVFVEPEGLRSESMYLNGLSTSLPRDVQERVVRTVPGLERAVFLRYGYAVEYDVVAPTQVNHQLQVCGIEGLSLGGQLLGTSGYEEAAALGFLAGVNAVRWLRGEAGLVLGREEAYLGVLVDDLVGRDHLEPYRMFSSRAEHRLALGVDSARERLMARGVELGLVPREAAERESRQAEAREVVRRRLEEERVNPDAATRAWVQRVAGIEVSAPTTWAGLLRRHDVDPERVASELPWMRALDEEDRGVVIARVRYQGYLGRHEKERERVRRLRAVAIPADIRYAEIPGLSREVVERLSRVRPVTLAEAEAVPGMTPAAIAILAGRVAAAGRGPA
jgi:tRNA uridine 5-carboxymethylaminomethyl modification enzyme